MSDVKSARKLVDLALDGKATQFESAFDMEVSTRIAQALNDKREQVSQTLFTGPLETEE